MGIESVVVDELCLIGSEVHVMDPEGMGREEVETLGLLTDLFSAIMLQGLVGHNYELWKEAVADIGKSVIGDPESVWKYLNRGNVEMRPGIGRSRVLEDYGELDEKIRAYLIERDLESGVGGAGLNGRSNGLDDRGSIQGLVRKMAGIVAAEAEGPLRLLFQAPADYIRKRGGRNTATDAEGSGSYENLSTRQDRVKYVSRVFSEAGVEVGTDAGWFERKFELGSGLLSLFKWLSLVPSGRASQKHRDLEEMRYKMLARKQLLGYFLNLHQKWGMDVEVAKGVFGELLFNQGLFEFCECYPAESDVRCFWSGFWGELNAGLALQQQGYSVQASEDDSEESWGVDLKGYWGDKLKLGVTVKACGLYTGPVLFFDLSEGVEEVKSFCESRGYPSRVVEKYVASAKEIVAWARKSGCTPVFGLGPQVVEVESDETVEDGSWWLEGGVDVDG